MVLGRVSNWQWKKRDSRFPLSSVMSAERTGLDLSHGFGESLLNRQWKKRDSRFPLSSVVERYTSSISMCVTCSGQPFDSASGNTFLGQSNRVFLLFSTRQLAAKLSRVSVNTGRLWPS
jgi:hypothetical protein